MVLVAGDRGDLVACWGDLVAEAYLGPPRLGAYQKVVDMLVVALNFAWSLAVASNSVELDSEA